MVREVPFQFWCTFFLEQSAFRYLPDLVVESAVCLATPGGYIIGFLVGALIMWGMEKVMGRKTWALAVQMVVGLIVCYAFGTAWFMIMYTRSAGPVGLVTVLGWCVFPFIIPWSDQGRGSTGTDKDV